MSTYELAELLLSGPDVSVAYWQYMGGNDELLEVEDVSYTDERNPVAVLLTYKEVK